MKPLPVAFRAAALTDLEEISRYITQHNPAAADRTVHRIHHVIFKTIAWFPMCGRLDAENGTREYPVPGLPYIVIYLPAAGFIDVVGVFHAARAPSAKPRSGG